MRNPTAMDLIDALAERVNRPVAEVNADRVVTQEQHLAAFRRAFEVALPKFLREMRGEFGDSLVDELERTYLAEYELQQVVEARLGRVRGDGGAARC